MLEEKEAEILTLQSEISNIEHQVEAAIEQEDYDLADKLDAQLVGKKDKLNTLKSDVSQLKKELGEGQALEEQTDQEKQ